MSEWSRPSRKRDWRTIATAIAWAVFALLLLTALYRQARLQMM